MIDHIILTVGNVERSLAFYEAARAPLNIKFFMPYVGKNGHPDLWGFGDGKRAFFWLKHGAPDPQNLHWGFKADNHTAVDAFYKAAIAAGARDNISPGGWNTIPVITLPMSLTRMDIHSRSSTRASERI